MVKNPILNIFFLFFLCFNIFLPFYADANFLDDKQLVVESGVSVLLPINIHNGVFDKFFSFFTYDFSKFGNSSFISVPVVSTSSEAFSNQGNDEKNNKFSFDLIREPSDKASAENSRNIAQHNDWSFVIMAGALILVFIFVLSEFFVGMFGLVETFYFLWTQRLASADGADELAAPAPQTFTPSAECYCYAILTLYLDNSYLSSRSLISC